MKILALKTPRKPRPEAEAPLLAPFQQMLDAALGQNGGDLPWRLRKRAEAAGLLRLVQSAPPGRLAVDRLDLRQALRARLYLRVKTPCRPDAEGALQVADFAVLGLNYPRDVLVKRLHGMSFFQVLVPDGVWHPNVGEAGQPLCLGAFLPVGIPVVELVYLAYGALSMQTAMTDEYDPAGVVNYAAAKWWQQNAGLAPLSATPLLGAGED